MRKALVVLAGVVPVLALGLGAAPPDAPDPNTSIQTRAALRRAVAESRAAAERSARLERDAETARDVAARTATEAAALAARIQQAEAGIAAAEARLSLATRERAILREQLGREQEPVVHLTAALQQFSRRPLALSALRPGSVKDAVYLRAMLDTTVPQIRGKTSSLRSRIAQSRRLREQALAASGQLRAEQTRLSQRRSELAALESQQRLASREASGTANREAERALALAEQARDLNSLVTELDRAGDLRQRLAALPGPELRPAEPENAQLADARPVPEPTGTAAPAPYLLPVTGRTVLGFGAPTDAGSSNGLTLAPRAGAQVVAPAAGRVAFAGPYRGYGQIVIIAHPNGWTSLVTGLARTDVSIGEQLVAGSPLGIAAQARPEITLELRRDGAPVNPLRFVG